MSKVFKKVRSRVLRLAWTKVLHGLQQHTAGAHAQIAQHSCTEHEYLDVESESHNGCPSETEARSSCQNWSIRRGCSENRHAACVAARYPMKIQALLTPEMYHLLPCAMKDEGERTNEQGDSRNTFSQPIPNFPVSRMRDVRCIE